MKFTSVYRVIITLLLISGITGIILGFTTYKDDGANYQTQHSRIWNEGYKPTAKIDTSAVLKQVYTETFKHYADSNAKIDSSFNYLIALILIGILIIVFKIQTIEIPFFKLDIPGKLVYIIVGMGLTYFWIHIGLLTNDSIDCRLALISIVQQTEVNLFAQEFSLINTLSDAAFIDNMTSFYYRVFLVSVPGREIPIKVLGALGLFGMYGTLLGLAMGVSLISFFEFLNESANKGSRYLGKSAFYFCFGIYVVATLCVLIKFHHMSNFFGYIWVVASIAMLVNFRNRASK